MDIVASLVLGALVGWLTSLFTRASTNEEILLDIAAGAAAGVALAEVLGNGNVFDSSLAGVVGAALCLAILVLVRRTQGRSDPGNPPVS